jgi:hypothetical protein
MPIVGPLPESGIRLECERPADGGPPWSYAGEVALPDSSFVLSAKVEADGAIELSFVPVAPEGLHERVRLLLRSAIKHARDEGRPPPRRIARWRPEG